MTGGWHYLDYAATSAVRPAAVADAVHRFLLEVGATPGRGGHRLSLEAGRVAVRCRQAVAGALGLPGGPARVAFLQNATQALNAALSGLLRPGDAAVTTVYDHNAVLRPLHRLVRERGVEARMIPGDAEGNLDLEAAVRLLEGARLLVVNGASNVLGTCLPLRALSALAREAGVLVLVDAAQWAGHFPPTLGKDGADLVAFTGHKGLLGPQGIGGLWSREGVEVEPFLAGGTGGDSLSMDMPGALPDRLEAGSLNAPGMAGLLAGIEFLRQEGIASVHDRVMGLKARLWHGLMGIRGVRVLSPPGESGVGIVTILPLGVEPGEMARRLDEEWGVLVRHGLNCAPEVHRVLGTAQSGAVRLSVGWASTPEDVEQALRGVDAIVSPTRISVS